MNSCRNPNNRARVEGKFDITGTMFSIFNEFVGLKLIINSIINQDNKIYVLYLAVLSCALCVLGLSQQYPISKLSSNSFERSPFVLII